MQQSLIIGFGLLVATFRTGDTEIFRVDPNTGDARNLTRSPNSSERYPSWSPERILTSSSRSTSRPRSMAVARHGGQGEDDAGSLKQLGMWSNAEREF